MTHRAHSSVPYKAFLFFTLAFCALLIVLVVFLSILHGGNNIYSFKEPVVTMSEGWTITNSSGVSRNIHLPETIEYGDDGIYTLSAMLPDDDGLILSPVIRFYSNYVDISVVLDGQPLYSFPDEEAAFSRATGNTYHFIRLPSDYAGKVLTVTVNCQLGNDITYLLNAPLLGSKATMLSADVMASIPLIMLAGCMMVLAIGLAALYITLRRQVKQNTATIYTALFAMLFAIYVCCETIFAQLFMPNGYLLCFCTLILLALMPLLLMGVFGDEVSGRFRPVTISLMILCSVNLIVQTILNFTGVMSVRAMLPATHAVIILSCLTMSMCLFFSDRKEKPHARRMLLSAMPMIIGGTADIILLSINRPSINNSFWFTLGVTAFIVLQFRAFIRNYFALYSKSLENRLLLDMAYRDALTNIGNRNAYERTLKMLEESRLTEQLGCIVVDINDLKLINNMYGHLAGDTAIIETGKLLCELMPKCASCFRTGGDEFVVLLDGYDKKDTQVLSERLWAEAQQRGRLCSIPLDLAIGFGHYEAGDKNIIDFIQRVDTLMFDRKRRLKENPAYPFHGVKN